VPEPLVSLEGLVPLDVLAAPESRDLWVTQVHLETLDSPDPVDPQD